jgi:hypothetical protein
MSVRKTSGLSTHRRFGSWLSYGLWDSKLYYELEIEKGWGSILTGFAAGFATGLTAGFAIFLSCYEIKEA